MKKREKQPEGGASWMDTYGDMVTLLLCFFVLLYSISSVDQAKWVNIVKSLNPNAKEVSQLVTTSDVVEGTEDVPGTNQTQTDQQFEAIYDNLESMLETLGSSAEVEIAEGDGYQFITYRDRVFFAGDSYVLLDEGKTMLDAFTAAIAPSAASIKEIQIFGHTTQADPNIPNEAVGDRLLSGDRAAIVAAYIQEKNIMDPGKIVGAGYGQYRPIDSFATEETSARNRRVEILITKDGSVEKSLDEYYKQVYPNGEEPASKPVQQ